MQFSKPVVLLVNALIVAIGVILLFVGMVFVGSLVGKELFVAIGTSLIAAGLINSLDRFISIKTPPEIRLITLRRKDLNRDFHNRKYTTDKFDLAAVAVKDCLKEIAEDPQNRMINHILFGRGRFRVIFVHPKSLFLKQRATEDKTNKDELIGLQKESVEYVVKFHKKLLAAYQRGKDNGHLDLNRIKDVEIRLINVNPYITIERFDDEINWGLYTSATEGKNCAMFSVVDQVDDKQSEVFDQLRKHFEALLYQSEPLLTLVSGQPPRLERGIVDKILTKNVVDSLLK